MVFVFAAQQMTNNGDTWDWEDEDPDDLDPDGTRMDIGAFPFNFNGCDDSDGD